MPKLRLTDIGVQNLKPTGEHADFWDTTLPTFGVRVAPSGTKTFVLKIYNGRRAIGRYPILSLSEARAEAKRLLAEKTLGRVRPQAITYPQAVAFFVEDKKRNKRASTTSEYRRVLNKFTFKGQLSEITHKEAARWLSSIKSPSAYDHALVYMRIFFNWCVKRRYITENPTAGLSTHAKVTRSRVLTDAELTSIWKACDSEDVPVHYRSIIKLLILTGQRRGEIAGLRAEWIDTDTITLPKHFTKNGREHAFPIPAMAQSIIAQVISERQQSATGTPFLFPARGSVTTSFNGWSKSKAALDKASGLTNWTLHDLRRTFATRLAEMAIAPHVIERLLNHVSGTISGIAAVYNRARYLDEMRVAMVLWEQRLTSILHPKNS